MDKIPDLKNKWIFADSSEPARIKSIKKAGYRKIRPVTKGQGSISAGITMVKSHRIYTMEENSNLNFELESYIWKQDKNTEEPTDVPVDLNNHLIDAMRYCIMEHYTVKPKVIKPFNRSILGV